MSNIRIGYDNIADDSTVSVTSSPVAAVNVVENALDWLEWDFWQIDTLSFNPSIVFTSTGTVTCGYVAFFAHDMIAATDEYVVQVSADSITWVNTVPWTSVKSGVNFLTFTSQAAKYWRVKFRRDAGATKLSPKIGVLTIGVFFDVGTAPQLGFIPPLAMDSLDSISNSVNGTFLGRNAKPMATDLKMTIKYRDAVWIRVYWLPFITHGRTKPFFVAWDEAGHATESAYCWTAKASDLPVPKYSSPTLMEAMLTAKAAI